MSTTPDPEDFASLFARARRQDARTTPTFEAVLERSRPARRSTLPALAAASVLATGLAGAVLLLRQEPRPPDADLIAEPIKPPRSNAMEVPPSTTQPRPEEVGQLQALGYLGAKKLEKGDAASPPAHPLAPTEFVQDLPAPGRFYQAVSGNVLGARERDFKAAASAEMVRVVGRTEAVDLAEAAPGLNTERYQRIDENAFLAATENPLSTFSIDVDTASYSVVRRYLTEGRLPPR
ncbi:MAG TPA: von Willebrand factor type A domain-containing protein, partial [Candidatus Polarisedimenticolaceae bacterium]|nr:von Willebrand factor type A domain-containing protein [Candidatus Polarisedimenticolaceae bacterium]